MSGVVIAFLVLTAVLLLAVVIGWGALVGWRHERVRARLLAERLIVDGRLEALTVQTLQAMREAARQHWSSRERQ